MKRNKELENDCVTNTSYVTSKRKGIKATCKLGVDSGGSFTKIVYFRPINAPSTLPSYVLREELPEVLPGIDPDPSLEITDAPTLKFIRIPRHNSSEFMDFVSQTNLHGQFKIERLNITGGGAYRLASELKEKLHIDVEPLGEMEMIVNGLNFLMERDLSNEVYTVDPTTKEKTFGILDHIKDSCFPYLLVNIGSGVSILKVNSHDSFERISGSTLGGGTFWALCRLLAKTDTYEQAQELSAKGDAKNVDLFVGDIYGYDSSAPGYTKLGLSPEVIASSFGKVAVQEDVPDIRPEDVVRSLMFMIANNITQIAYLCAKLHKTDRIIFTGGFLAGNLYLMSRFSYALQFWSESKVQAIFLRHDGYLGALGCMLHGTKNHDTEEEALFAKDVK
jgi:type II pantothenate kinase